MDRISRFTFKLAGLILILAPILLFPPFRLGNGQPQWAFFATPPSVTSWVIWDETIAHNFHKAGIHWGFLIMEVFVITVMVVSIWASMNDNSHHHGHK
jgi:hypothetical protein